MESGLRILDRSSYKLEMELELQLSSSFPREGDAEKIREMFRADLRTDSMGVGATMRDDRIHFAYPVEIFVGSKDRR